MCLLSGLCAVNSNNHVILDQYRDYFFQPSTLAEAVGYQGVKTVLFHKKMKWAHIIISNRVPASLSPHRYVQLEKHHSRCLRDRAK